MCATCVRNWDWWQLSRPVPGHRLSFGDGQGELRKDLSVRSDRRGGVCAAAEPGTHQWRTTNTTEFPAARQAGSSAYHGVLVEQGVKEDGDKVARTIHQPVPHHLTRQTVMVKFDKPQRDPAALWKPRRPGRGGEEALENESGTSIRRSSNL